MKVLFSPKNINIYLKKSIVIMTKPNIFFLKLPLHITRN